MLIKKIENDRKYHEYTLKKDKLVGGTETEWLSINRLIDTENVYTI